MAKCTRRWAVCARSLGSREAVADFSFERGRLVLNTQVSKTRGAIIDAARVLFLDRGYEGTSTDAVAAAVPVSKRTLYNHFPSKAELFEAVIGESWSWLLSPGSQFLVDAKPRTHDEAAKVLTRYGQAVLEHWDNPDVVALIRLVIAEAARVPEMAKAFLGHGKAPAVSRLTGFLEFVVAEGISDIPNPAIAAWQFHGMLKEPIFLPTALGLPRPFPAKQVVASAVRLALPKPSKTR